MAREHRIIDEDGNPLDYTCENSRFKTDLSKSAEGGRPGSVLPEALFDGGTFTLWLEHVVEKENGRHVYWLMWYSDGRPTMPMSGVLDRNDLNEMIINLTDINNRLLEGAA